MLTRRAFSVAVFARHANKVLLIRHRRLGTWLPVGGEIEPGETPLEAARRELYEETGLQGRFVAQLGVEGTPPGLIGYEEHMAGSKGLHMNFAFVAELDSGEVRPNDEYSEHCFVTHAEDVDCPHNVRELVRAAQHQSGGQGPLADLAREWLAAFNARDLDRLLALYDDGAVHTSPKLRARDPATNGQIRGKAALRDWWADSFRRLPGLVYTERGITTGADRVVLEYERTVPGEPALLVAETFVVRGSLIHASHVFHG